MGARTSVAARSFLLCFERHAIAREQHVCLCEQGSQASKDALAVTLITDKGHVGSRKREIALANLALQARRERLRQEQVGIADAPYQPIHVDREVRNLALLLRRL